MDDPALSTNPNQISAKAAASTWGAAALSKSGTCFFLYDGGSSPIVYGQTATAADCKGSNAASHSEGW